MGKWRPSVHMRSKCCTGKLWNGQQLELSSVSMSMSCAERLDTDRKKPKKSTKESSRKLSIVSHITVAARLTHFSRNSNSKIYSWERALIAAHFAQFTVKILINRANNCVRVSFFFRWIFVSISFVVVCRFVITSKCALLFLFFAFILLFFFFFVTLAEKIQC